ncbi:MAG TPA: glycosyltransferase [Pseudolabrys sp.]|nr:glycosyltransferase [Pseudolabrys sp.]
MMRIYVDHTHLGRRVTGLERITQELFSAEALAPLPIQPLTAHGAAQMLMMQSIGLPLCLLRARGAVLLCPGFPPSPLLWPLRARVLPYIHDVFLLSRRANLNLRAKLYMAEPFRLAVRSYPHFLANSEDTRRKLAPLCRADASITLYRPQVRNVFALDAGVRDARPDAAPFRLVALGTVEPRKNFVAAAEIVGALRANGVDARLDVVGRRGWGDDWQALSRLPHVTLHGYQPEARVRALLNAADAFICTSREEGLGLPLLEAQFGGLPIIAPDQAIFREVLDRSGLFADPAQPAAAAATIAGALNRPGWRAAHRHGAERNLGRWNALAAADREAVIALIRELARDPARLNLDARRRQAA